jgi:tetrahydromethanopterin S-methyltransferase subunit A
VAICTLTEEPLSARVAEEAGPEVSIVGTLQTENLGIERLIRNVVTNPNIRFLVLCGSDSTNQIGHLPGQSLLALARFGLDERSRILGAEGKRPFLKNVPREAVRHFCRAVELVDLIGNQKLSDIFEVTGACAARSPGSADPFSAEVAIEPIQGCLPKKSVPDPAGYFVIYVDRRRRLLSLEHYRSDGVLDAVIEGGSAAELYSPAIEKELISRLDHAAYLGRELARAERTLVSGEPYVQDPAPEQHTNG